MKKALCYFLVIIVAVVSFSPTLAAESENVLLSELSAEECMEFVNLQGIEIPDMYQNEMTWAPFVHYVIAEVEENPNVVFSFGMASLLRFANDIKAAVNDYYGTSNTSQYTLTRESAVLQDNTVLVQWTENFLNYNCYAYAIGNTWRTIDPGQLEWESLGNDGDDFYYNDTANVYTIAYNVKKDLESLGYTVINTSLQLPDSSVSAHTNVICVRKDADGVYLQYGNYLFHIYDYHFMKLCEDGYWHHKPGQTSPLRYNYTPSSNLEWTVETYDYFNGENRIDFWTYDSEIYFIEYTTPHTYEYRMTGTSQHILTCTICGETSGIARNCLYVDGVCRLCGRPEIAGGGIITSIREEDAA